MALSEESLAELKQHQDFDSEGKENRAQPATNLDPLVLLLGELKILGRAEKSNFQPSQASKDSSEVVSDSVVKSEVSPEKTLIPNDTNLDNFKSESAAESEPDPLANLFLQLDKLTEPFKLNSDSYWPKNSTSGVVEEGSILPNLSTISDELDHKSVSLSSASESEPDLDLDRDLQTELSPEAQPNNAQEDGEKIYPTTVISRDDLVPQEPTKKPNTNDLVNQNEGVKAWQNDDFVRPIPIAESRSTQAKYLDILAAAVISPENLVTVQTSIPKEITPQLSEDHVLNSTVEKELPAQLKEKLESEIGLDKSTNLTDNSGESFEAIEQLQNLIFGSKISELDDLKTLLADTDLPGICDLMARLDLQLRKLEHQIYEPQELIALLLPWIGDILNLKIVESREEIVKVLVPIIDDVIKAKTTEDKQGMSAAIANLLPEAISQQIQNAPEEMANAIAPEIAIAIREQIRLDQTSIAEALAPEMGRAIKAQIELERDAMVDALYPVIGNTIAKYMAEAIRTINEKVSNAFSVEGVTRKIRSQIQGVSEAELILKESIPFVVKAVFLIHKGSGLVISDLQPNDQPKLESDMIGGMLTAIRSFVNDCISQTGEIAELNEIEYGDCKIILEVAGYCYLSVVIKGESPKEFIRIMRETLSTIIMKYSQVIEFYDGDPDTIPAQLHTNLQRIFQQVPKEKEKKPPLALLALGVVVSALFLVPWGMYEYRQRAEREIEKNTGIALASTPDLAIYRLGVNVEQDTLTITGNLPNKGLRTKAEKIVKVIAPTLKVDNQIVAVDVPPDLSLVTAEVKRVTAILNQMEGVAISSHYEDRKVTVEGTVILMADAQKIAKSMKQIPGVQSVISTVKLNPLKITTRIYFDAGSTKLNSEYGDILGNIKEFLKQYPQKQLKIIGHSDRLGNPIINEQIAQERAKAVQVALIEQGVDPRRLLIVGISNPPADVESSQPLLLSRCVVFEPITKGLKSK
jgi:outer membrane protein OmpA-like peptidoglycan-associated protein